MSSYKKDIIVLYSHPYRFRAGLNFNYRYRIVVICLVFSIYVVTELSVDLISAVNQIIQMLTPPIPILFVFKSFKVLLKPNYTGIIVYSYY